MNRLIKWFNLIIIKQKGLKRWQRVVTVLAAMITFATTYALILPAITVEKNGTEDVGGMYLEKTAEQDDLLEENALEPIGVSIAADMDNAVSFAYSDDDMTATAIFSTDEIIPEGAELVVNNVTSDSEEYADLSGRAADLLDKEFIYDVTSCSFYDFALVCDNVDVTPKTGMVDIQIIFRNNTNQHVNDVVYVGRFARPSEDADGFAAMAVSTVEAGAEADDAVSVNDTAVNDNSAGESGNPSVGEDELVSLNIDESSAIELSDGIITSLSLKGSDLSRSDSLVGIIAGYVDEEIKAAAAETDAEIPEYDESQDEDEQRSSGEDASANADNNVSTSPEEDSSGTSAEDERKEITDALQMKTLKASGKDYTVILTYDETSGISEEAVLTVSEIAQGSKEYNTYLEETKKAMGLKEEETLPGFAARFFDIKIMVDGKEFNPESGVSVEITYAEPLAEKDDAEVSAVHFADENAEAEVIEANTAEVQDDGQATVEFTAESFSVYGVVYTVDFHWEVDGKTYDFSIPGGGYVTLRQLVEVLGIVDSDADGKNASNDEGDSGDSSADVDVYDSGEVNGINNTTTYLNVKISDKTREFVADVVRVEFNNPNLVWVGKAEEDSTVGGLKDANGLECQYSVELTEEQIAEINAQTVESGDWVLISKLPFTSEEELTVTMENGDQFVMKVTDANVNPADLTSSDGVIIYTIVNGNKYMLGTDGITYGPVTDTDMENAGNEYKWKITRTYTESDGNQFNYGQDHYRISALTTNTINLNLTEDNNSIARRNASDTLIMSHPDVSGAYALAGIKKYMNYWNVPTPLLVTENGQLHADKDTDYTGIYWWDWWGGPVPEYAPIYFYKQNTTAYEYTVRVEDARMGTVSGVDKEGNQVNKVTTFDSKTNDTAGSTPKTNQYAITAIATGSEGREPEAQRLIFDKWTLNGQDLDSNQYPATIPEGALTIPGNGAVLVAHFKDNPDYDPTKDPDGHSATSKDEFYEWLANQKENNEALVTDSFKKTSEVYDYENRIYRVDLTASSNMTIFDGNADMAFVIDVSASMKFPAELAPLVSDVNIYNINRDWSNWGLTQVTKDKCYYVIADKESTATVCRLWYQNGEWKIQDASKSATDTSTEYSANADRTSPVWWDNSHSSEKQHMIIYKISDEYNQATDPADLYAKRSGTEGTHVITNNGKKYKTRAAYLEYSIEAAIKEMYNIQQQLAIAKDGNNDYQPRIAYNTFRKFLPAHNYVFQNAPQNGNIGITYSYDGGTSTDIAILDGAGFTRSDTINNGTCTVYSSASGWKQDANDHGSLIYTDERPGRGFQWDSNSTNRFAMIITDGAPQRDSKDIDEIYLATAKEKLELSNVNLVTIGLSMGDVKNGADKLIRLADRDSTNMPLYYRADTGAKLTEAIYETLKTTIGKAVTVGTVTDTVGEAFYPVDRSRGTPLKNGDWIDLNGNLLENNTENEKKPHGVISEREDAGKTWYDVQWTNQPIAYGTDEEPGWHGSVYVKAKEDFLGANVVDTNKGDAAISVTGFKNNDDPDNATIELKDNLKRSDSATTPRVNVNELSFSNNNSEWTVYVGQHVDPLDEIKALFNLVEVRQVIKAGIDTDNNGIPDEVAQDSNAGHTYNENMSFTLPANIDEMISDGRTAGERASFKLKDLLKNLYASAPNDAEWKNLLTAEGDIDWDTVIGESLESGEIDPLRIPYNVYGIDGDSFIEIKLIQDPGRITGELDTGHNAGEYTNETKVGDELEKYTLRVSFEPDYNKIVRQIGDFESEYEGNKAGAERKDNIHTINVYAEPLEVMKKDKDTNAKLQGATFSIFRAIKDGETGQKLKQYDAFFGDNEYYCIDTQITGTNGIAQLAVPQEVDTSQNLLVAGETYYLIETNPPNGYKKDPDAPAYYTVTVEPTDGVYSKLDGTVLNAKTYPFNWNQGVTLKVNGTAVTIVDSTSRNPASLGRTYVLKSDAVAFQYDVLNIKAADIRIFKVDGDGETGLPGAIFQLYVKDGSYRLVTADDGISGLGTVENGNDTYQSAFKSDGNELTLGGLVDGDYQLKEVHVPNGYINTIGDINFSVSNGVVTLLSTSSKLHLDPASTGEVPNSALLTITNELGAALPSTGGPGTNLFYLIGCILTVLAGAGIVMRRRCNKTM